MNNDSNDNNTIVLASGNAGKLKEFQQLLYQCGLQVAPQADWQIPEAEETGFSFVENAILKARNACQHTGLAAIADDSGLEVDALNGAPGVYSARFSGLDATDADNNAYLLQKLANVADNARGARYHCVLVYMRHAEDPTPLICHGQWEGRILREPAGDGGFGYDPLFYVTDQHCAAAELSKDIKNQLSHRGRAMRELLAQLQHRS